MSTFSLSNTKLNGKRLLVSSVVTRRGRDERKSFGLSVSVLPSDIPGGSGLPFIGETVSFLANRFVDFCILVFISPIIMLSFFSYMCIIVATSYRTSNARLAAIFSPLQLIFLVPFWWLAKWFACFKSAPAIATEGEITAAIVMVTLREGVFTMLRCVLYRFVCRNESVLIHCTLSCNLNSNLNSNSNGTP